MGAAAGARGGERRRRRLRSTPTPGRAPGLVGALAGALRDADLVTAGARFVCETPGERLLHPSMLASLVYRFGPADVDRPPRRILLPTASAPPCAGEPLLAAGGYALAAGHMTDDVALARALARAAGGSPSSTAALVDVRMYESAAETWREWGRSLALPDVTPPAWQAADLAVVWLAMALPVAARRRGPRRRGSTSRCWRCAARCSLPLAGAYARRGAPFWLSPLADPATAVRLTLSALRPARTWRGRTYRAPACARAANSAPMNAISAPVADHVLDRVGRELDDGEREHAGARAPREARREA